MPANFDAGQAQGDVWLFARTDHEQIGEQDYRFILTDATGEGLGGSIVVDLTIHDTDLVGDWQADTLQSAKLSEVIWTGAGNDTIIASSGDELRGAKGQKLRRAARGCRQIHLFRQGRQHGSGVQFG